MSDHIAGKPSSRRARALSRNTRDRDSAMEPRGGDPLGLTAFEKISAIEGVCLSDVMRADLAHMKQVGLSTHERLRFILDKYAKE